MLSSPGRRGRVAWLTPDESNQCDLRWNTKPHRRPPITRTAIDVDPHAAQPIQTRGERLLQAHEKIPRPELPAVRVSGQLKVITSIHRGRSGTRLVSEH